MKTRITQLTILPEGEPIFSEQAVNVRIEDEAGGEYVVIDVRDDDAKPGVVPINPDQWPAIRAAVNRFFKDIKANDRKTK